MFDCVGEVVESLLAVPLFDSVEHANAYLESQMFNDDVAVGLKPTWSSEPKIVIYTVA